MYNKLFQIISQCKELSDVERNFIQKHFKIKYYKKNEMILTEGEIAKSMYFIIDGFVRLFYNIEGNEKTAFFYSEEKFIWPGESYSYEVPGIENYQALENTTLVVLEKNTLEELISLSPGFDNIIRIGTETELISYQRLIASFITRSPEERYVHLMQKNSKLFQRIPQHYIASYLGVSAETLSRIKKRVLYKQRNNCNENYQKLALAI
jgi:CRP/FNR family transcriptional regulator, anaerobic regulatory protein